MIGANDLFIAAHARALGLTLVTNNTTEFERVSDLTIENWTVPTRRVGPRLVTRHYGVWNDEQTTASPSVLSARPRSG